MGIHKYQVQESGHGLLHLQRESITPEDGYTRRSRERSSGRFQTV